MAPSKPRPSIPSGIARAPDAYWNRERLEAVLDWLIARQGEEPLGADEIGHAFRSGHTYLSRYESDDECSTCGESIRGEGQPLLGALAVVADEAVPDSKWAGLVIKKETGYWDSYRLRFASSRAAEWVAEQQARQSSLTPTDPSTPSLTIGLLEALWPEERIRLAQRLSDRYMDAGDIATAAALRYGFIPSLEKWTMMKVTAGSASRRVLTDYEGQTWLAVPLDDATIVVGDPGGG